MGFEADSIDMRGAPKFINSLTSKKPAPKKDRLLHYDAYLYAFATSPTISATDSKPPPDRYQ